MRKAIAVFTFVASIMLLTALAAPVLATGGQASASLATNHGYVVTQMNAMPLAFTPNEGQWADSILFRAESQRATLWFTATGVYHQLTQRMPRPGSDRLGMAKTAELPMPGHEREIGDIETELVKATFVGGSALEVLPAGEVLDWNSNYFLGNEPCKWRTDVPNYSAITYKNVYPGIDLTYRGDGKGIEYDFAVSPGADPSQIAIRYDGASGISVDRDGNLVVATRLGKVIERCPATFQLAGGERKPIDGAFRPMDNHTFAFQLSDDYNPVLALIIDPVLTYGTYVGGAAGGENGWGIAVDASGNAYVSGPTTSSDFPTQNPYDGSYNGGTYDAFISKLTAAGNSLVYSTFLGGGQKDLVYGFAVDASGKAYVSGQTNSSDFPTQNAFDGSYNGAGSLNYGDAFLTKLSAAGNGLVYSTYLGGSGDDIGGPVTVDLSGSAYVAGRTISSDFPTQNPYDASYNGNSDVFVTKFSPAGNVLVYGLPPIWWTVS